MGGITLTIQAGDKFKAKRGGRFVIALSGRFPNEIVLWGTEACREGRSWIASRNDPSGVPEGGHGWYWDAHWVKDYFDPIPKRKINLRARKNV